MMIAPAPIAGANTSSVSSTGLPAGTMIQAIFGADRCLFGSNFPIEKLWTTYRELVDAYRAATAYLRADQRDAVLRATAARVYRLGT